MPFFRSLKQTAPAYSDKVPWPIDGLAYVIAFFGPVCGGLVAGVTTRSWVGVLVGILVGITTTLLHGWLSDTFIDRWIGRFQAPLNRTMPRVCINIAGFSWAMGLSVGCMFATWTILTTLNILPSR